jgi:hypothetical protein
VTRVIDASRLTISGLRAGLEASEAERQRLQEALEWTDAMLWPMITMAERHAKAGKPWTSEQFTGALRRILGPLRRSHKEAVKVAAIGDEIAALREEVARLKGEHGTDTSRQTAGRPEPAGSAADEPAGRHHSHAG